MGGAAVAGQRRGRRPVQKWGDAPILSLPERPRRRGATVAGKKRGGRPGAGEWYDATPLSIAKLRRHSAVVALLEESRPLPLGKPRLLRQQSDVQCSICLGPCVERAWTKCNHSFCRKCITQVCRTNPSTNRAPCPFCRQPVLLGELTRRPSVAGCAMS